MTLTIILSPMYFNVFTKRELFLVVLSLLVGMFIEKVWSELSKEDWCPALNKVKKYMSIKVTDAPLVSGSLIVSFDFDSTLSRKDVQEYAKELLERGIDVWVVTTVYLISSCCN